jgi:hypothetical protein
VLAGMPWRGWLWMLTEQHTKKGNFIPTKENEKMEIDLYLNDAQHE